MILLLYACRNMDSRTIRHFLTWESDIFAWALSRRWRCTSFTSAIRIFPMAGRIYPSSLAWYIRQLWAVIVPRFFASPGSLAFGSMYCSSQVFAQTDTSIFPSSRSSPRFTASFIEAILSASSCSVSPRNAVCRYRRGIRAAFLIPPPRSCAAGVPPSSRRSSIPARAP